MPVLSQGRHDPYLSRAAALMPAMLAYWDLQLRCRFANPAYAGWFGLDAAQIVGRPLVDLLGPAHFEQDRPRILAVLAGQAQSFEQSRPGPEGRLQRSQVQFLPDIVDGGVRGFAVHAIELGADTQAKDDLLDSQQNLEVTLASIDAGFLGIDREGRVCTMNSHAERITGWPLAEAKGRPLWEVFEREDRPAHFARQNPVDLSIELGITADAAHHIVLRTRDGRRVPLETKAAVTRHRDGQARGLAIVFRDMTRLMQAEADSRRLAAIVESSSDAIIGKMLDGRITSWNRAAQATFGYSAEEALGQSIRMLIPPERIDEEMRILGQIGQGLSVTAFDTQRRHKLGHLVVVSLSISPIRDGTGSIVGASKIARDITARRRIERELRNSESRLRFTVEAAGVGVWEFDPDSGQFTRSLQHDRCFGHPQACPSWTLDDLQQRLHPDDRAEVLQRFSHTGLAGAAWSVECRVRWPDGSEHWISLHGRPDDSEGSTPKMRGVVFDITARRQEQEARLRARQLEAENRQIQEASRLKSLFLANMSHELRTPLNAIIGFAELLHRGMVPPQSGKHHEFLGHIASSGRHLLQLINDVLDLAKIESGKFDFMPERIQLPRLVKEALDVLQIAFERKQLQLAVEIDPTLDDLFLDPSRLKQVIYNYLSNAIKFTPEQGRVTVRARAAGARHFRLEVEDTGIGISLADQARLFTDFQQLDSGYSKQHQGTGLGLALTRRLVQAQGGQVGVRSTPGVGSVFHVLLNRVHGSDLPIDSATPSAGTLQERLRLLLIEPDARVTDQLAQGLAKAGFEVDSAASAQHALQHARRTRYDGLTLDLALPDGHGLDLLARLRAQQASRQVPVLGLTVPGSDHGSAAFGIANILDKPLRVDEVASAMRGLQQQPGGAPLRVMVIDDEPAALALMCATLDGLGIQADCFDDGRHALQHLESGAPPAAIVLDLMMPGFNGFDVLEALHRMPEARSIPVYVWTSMLLTDAEYQQLSLSAQGILAKGGGALSALLASLLRWRAAAEPPMAQDT